MPKGLVRDHTTKRGTWGRIVVLEGTVTFVDEESGEVGLTAGRDGIVVPERPHRVSLSDDARFRVDFYRMPASMRGSVE